MTLDEAIKHAEEVAIEQDKLCKRYDGASGYSRSHNEAIRTTEAKRCEECAEEHRQLAEWLKDYKRLLEQEHCGDCISRQAVISTIYDDQSDFKNDFAQGFFADKIRGLPPVPLQEPEMGRWIDIIVGDMPAQACDKCNVFYPLSYTGGGHKFCPNCGRKMQEVEGR